MKKRSFLLVLVLVVSLFIFAGCLQKQPEPEPQPEPQPGLKLDGIAKAKYDFVTGAATQSTITGTVLCIDGSYVILQDATTGALVFDSKFSSTTGAKAGDKITLDGTPVYYFNDIEYKYNTVSYGATQTTTETLTPTKLDITLNNDWLVVADKNGAVSKTTSDATNLSLWLYRYVTVEGTTTITGTRDFTVEYETDAGTATLVGYNRAGKLTVHESAPATVTGYLAGYGNKWQLCVWDPSNIEY